MCLCSASGTGNVEAPSAPPLLFYLTLGLTPLALQAPKLIPDVCRQQSTDFSRCLFSPRLLLFTLTQMAEKRHEREVSAESGPLPGSVLAGLLSLGKRLLQRVRGVQVLSSRNKLSLFTAWGSPFILESFLTPIFLSFKMGLQSSLSRAISVFQEHR